MKKLSILLVAFLMVTGLTVHAQDKAPKSPPMEVSGSIGGAKIVINYSSPSVKDRTIYGKLVPYGEVWRAGANEATTFSFSNTVTINGTKLVAGTYSFFVIPNKEGNWEIIFNKEPKQWGAYKLDREKDALVSESSISEIEKVEKLTYSINGNYIYLDWDTTRLSIKVN